MDEIKNNAENVAQPFLRIADKERFCREWEEARDKVLKALRKKKMVAKDRTVSGVTF